jgi:hypothetical protein
LLARGLGCLRIKLGWTGRSIKGLDDFRCMMLSGVVLKVGFFLLGSFCLPFFASRDYCRLVMVVLSFHLAWLGFSRVFVGKRDLGWDLLLAWTEIIVSLQFRDQQHKEQARIFLTELKPLSRSLCSNRHS